MTDNIDRRRDTEPETLTADDIWRFATYLRCCTDKQVRGVYDKERKAGRNCYAALAEVEAQRRGLFFVD